MSYYFVFSIIILYLAHSCKRMCARLRTRVKTRDFIHIIALASASGAVTTLSPSAQGAEGLLSGPDTSEKIHSGGRRPPEVTRHK